VDGMINVLHADEFPRPDFNQMINTVANLARKVNIEFENNSRIFVDGSNPSFIRALKDRLDEDPEYENYIDNLKRNLKRSYNLELLEINVRNSCSLQQRIQEYASSLQKSTGISRGSIAIHPQFTKLITALRTAVENGQGMLDKDAASHDDLFDDFRMPLSLLQFYH
jgi:hypothetical protein